MSFLADPVLTSSPHRPSSRTPPSRRVVINSRSGFARCTPAPAPPSPPPAKIGKTPFAGSRLNALLASCLLEGPLLGIRHAVVGALLAMVTNGPKEGLAVPAAEHSTSSIERKVLHAPRAHATHPFFFFFSHTFTFQLLLDNKPWSQVSSLLAPGSCLQLLSCKGVSNPTPRPFFHREPIQHSVSITNLGLYLQ